MNGVLEKQRLAEIRNLRVRWIFIVALILLGVAGHMTLCDWGVIAALSLLGLIYHAECKDVKRYERTGMNIISFIRGADCAILVGLTWSKTYYPCNLWLVTVPLLMIEANTRRSTFRLAALVGVIIAVAIGLFATKTIGLVQFETIAGVTALTGIFSSLIKSMSMREDRLQQHDRRFEAMISSSSALAKSRDLNAMLDHILKTAVEEVGGDSGYVMVLDEDNPSQLRTEVAYGAKGEFELPDSLRLGEGLSGYVVEMSQPIALHNKERKTLECDGIDLGVRSVISVPLTSRILIGSNESGQEQTLGALTVIGDPSGSSFGPDDMELLCSMGSLMAVAVSNARMEGRQRTTFLRTLESLATALEARDEYTRGHSQRVCEVSLMIAEHLGFTGEAIEELRVGTILHDIGKIGVPDSILNKKGRLDDEEFAIMKSHPVIGYDICKPLMLDDGVLMIIRNHHEKLDGSGYPDGLRGGELPPSLRIVCVADAFDAMSSKRPYRGVMDTDEVFRELSKWAGIQFDPVVVEALRELLPTARLQNLYRQYWQPEVKLAA